MSKRNDSNQSDAPVIDAPPDERPVNEAPALSPADASPGGVRDVALSERLVVVGANTPSGPLPLTDDDSEEFRRQIGHTADTAAEDLDRALLGTGAAAGAARPFKVVAAERRRAADEARSHSEPKSNADVAAALAPLDTDANRADLIRSVAAPLSNSFGIWVESIDNPDVKYRVTQNASDQALNIETAPGSIAVCLPGDFYGEDADGNRVVLSAALAHSDYRPARRGPNGRAIAAI